MILEAASPAVLIAACGTADLDTLGRVGSGPGEYRGPVAMAVTGAGEVVILDQQLSRVSRWSHAGTFLDDVTVPSMATTGKVDIGPNRDIYFGDLSSYSPAFLTPADRPNRAADSGWVYRWSPATELTDTAASIRIGSAGVLGGVAKVPMRFDPDDAWGVLLDGSVWVARMREFRIDRYPRDGNAPIVGVPQSWKAIRTGPADVRRRRNIVPGPPDSIEWPMAPTKPPFARAIGGVDGEVWVELTRPNGDPVQRYARIRAGGDVLGPSVAVDSSETVMLIAPERVCTTVQDRDGFFAVRCYARPTAGGLAPTEY